MPSRRVLSCLAQYFPAGLFALLLCAPPLAAQNKGQPSPPQASPAAASALAFHQDVIAEIPAGSELEDWLSTGSHVAWAEKKGSAWIVKLDGKQQGGTYDDLEYLEFSDEGTHLAFFGKRNSKWALVLDGQERSPEYLHASSVAFQPHGNSFAFGACTAKKKCSLVVDGKANGAVYDDLSYPQYSDNGKQLAYFGKHGKKWVAIVDGKETGPEVDDFAASEWGFSPDGGHFFVAAAMDRKMAYVVDGTPGPGCVTISPIAFSRDGKDYAYSGALERLGFKKSKTSAVVVVDGRAQATYQGRGLTGYWASLVSAAGAAAGTGFYEGPASLSGGVRILSADLDGVSDPVFAPDGKLFYAARQGKGDVFVTDGQRDGPSFDDIVSGIAFSKDSRHFAYIARRGKDFVEVRDNHPGATFSVKGNDRFFAVGLVQWMIMTPDGAHLAYELVRGGADFKNGHSPRARRTVVIDGRPGKEYNAIFVSPIQFSKDARHYCYAVFGASGKRDLVVVDGRESKLYNGVTDPAFAADGKSMTFVAQDSARLVRVTLPLQ